MQWVAKMGARAMFNPIVLPAAPEENIDGWLDQAKGMREVQEREILPIPTPRPPKAKGWGIRV